MSKNRFVRADPVTLLAAVMALGQQVVLGLQYIQDWSGTATGLIGSIWTAFIAVVGSPFAKAKVTSNSIVRERARTIAHDSIVAMSDAGMAPAAVPPLVENAPSPPLPVIDR